MIRVDTRPRKRNAPRPAEKSALGYLQWLRGRQCVAITTDYVGCQGRIEAAHTYGAGDRGMSTKSSDRYAIPMCSYHHARQHSIGWKTFEVVCLAGKSAPALAEQYWRVWPGRAAWERKLNGASHS